MIAIKRSVTIWKLSDNSINAFGIRNHAFGLMFPHQASGFFE